MLGYAPSLIAASAIFLAKYMFLPSKRPWVGFVSVIFLFLLVIVIKYDPFSQRLVIIPMCIGAEFNIAALHTLPAW